MKCSRCNGTGWASASRDAGQPDDTPVMDRLIGVYSCPNCGGTGKGDHGLNISPELRKIVREAFRKARRKSKRKGSRRNSGS